MRTVLESFALPLLSGCVLIHSDPCRLCSVELLRLEEDTANDARNEWSGELSSRRLVAVRPSSNSSGKDAMTELQ